MLSAFAELFFYFFMLSQFIVLVLITPAYVGDAIAEEKERRTLDYLLTTHLTDREIVVGKLTSRITNALLFLLAGLPILSLTQLLGGVSPELLWTGFACTALTLLSVAGISLLQSLYAKRSRNAIILTYLLMLCFVVIWGVGENLVEIMNRAAKPPPTVYLGPPFRPVMTPAPPPGPSAAQEWIEWGVSGLRAGNPISAFQTITDHVKAGGTYAQVLPDVLFRYLIFHGSVFLICSGWVMLRLRRVLGSPGRFRRRKIPPVSSPSRVIVKRAKVVKYRSGGLVLGDLSLFVCVSLAVASLIPLASLLVFFSALGVLHTGETGRIMAVVMLPPFALAAVALLLWNRRRRRRKLGDAPMIWKEVDVEGGFRLGWLSKLLILSLALGCIIPGVLIHFAGHSGLGRLSAEANAYSRFVGTLVACLALLAIGIRAASSVGVERDKQTWDGLLTSPLTNREILLGKWLGALSSARWLIGLLAIVWLLSFLGEGLSIAAPFLLLACLAVYGLFMASLGLLIGIVAKSTLRAVMGTVFAALVAGSVPWFCHYLLTEGDPYWSVPTVLGVLAVSALFVSSPLLAVGIWIKKTFRSIRGLTAAVYLMCAFPLVGYFVVLGLLEHGSEYSFRTWGENVVNGITPPVVLADTAYYFHPHYDSGYYPPPLGSWEYGRYGRGLRVLCRALGLTAYLFMAALLWIVAQSRFLHTCGRIEGQARENSGVPISKSETHPRTKIPNLTAEL
jgi:ABC-type transport system involved in multi-copper enzyme maturation permease subunit